MQDEVRGPGSVAIRITVNGREHPLEVEPRMTLLDAIRQKLNLTGSKRVCDSGACGACTMIVDGRAIYACMTLAIACDGASVTTIEGLSGEGELHPIQKAFVEKDGYQCGFCTPGQVLAAKALLDRNPHPSRDEIRRGMSGNLCRCGAYLKIIDSVSYAAELIAKAGE